MADRPSRFKSPEAQARFYGKYDSLLAQWPVPYEERYIETGLGTTHVIVCGPEDAPPLILLHGFHGTALMWITHIALLSRSYRCYLVETVGDVGKSLSRRPARNTDDYVAWLKEVYGGLGLSRARVMGLSHGGWLAALLALHAPDLVERLVLLCPVGTLAEMPISFLLRAMPGMITGWAPLIRSYWGWFLYDKANLAHPSTELFVLAMQNFALSNIHVRANIFTDEELGRLTMPTTLLIGDHEVVYGCGPAQALKRGQALIPGVKAHLIPNASHCQTLDNPTETGRLMLQGLA